MSSLSIPSASVAGFILAGGQSSRMGSDKALSRFADGLLIENALGLFAAIGVKARIAGSRSDLSAFGPTIPDTFLNVGPLGGIHAALSVSVCEWNLFLPVDMALLPASLLSLLLNRAAMTGAPVSVIKRNGRLEPFPVLLHSSVLPQVTERLDKGQTAPYQAWNAIPPHLNSTLSSNLSSNLNSNLNSTLSSNLNSTLSSNLDAPAVENLVQCGQCRHPLGLPAAAWFQSANTPGDLARLNRLHDSSRPSGFPGGARRPIR